MPTRQIPPKAPTMQITSTSEISSLSHRQVKIAMRKGLAFMTMKKILKGKYLIANTKVRKQIVPATHLTNKTDLFPDSLSCRTSLKAPVSFAHFKKKVDAIRL